MKRIRMILVFACAIAPMLACNLLTTPTAQPPANALESINVETSVARTLDFERAVQAAVASAQPGQATQDVPPAQQPPGPTVEPTQGVPMISASVDTNCRKGPATIYEAISYLLVGKTSEVVNKYQNGLWWVIKDPNNPAQRCWVWGSTTMVTGDWQSLPEATQPPTPTVQLVLSLDGSASPANYWGACPVTITYTFNIQSNMPVNMGYHVASSESPFSALKSTSFGPGTKTFNLDQSYNASGTYWKQFYIDSPLIMNHKVEVSVHCL